MPDDLGRHLWSIVGPDVFRDTPDQHHVRHSLNHTQTVDPAGNTDRQAFPRKLVDQCHKPNLAAIMRLGFDKVVRPDVVIPASRHAIGADLPCDIKTSIWRSKITICSALKRFFGITRFLSKAVSIKPLGTKRPGQVNVVDQLLEMAEL